ncbi:MAG: lipocalin family protein [Saprospiraceae bacterium]|nr:lipocalin family protein [Saprospiraceae bacterium]
MKTSIKPLIFLLFSIVLGACSKEETRLIADDLVGAWDIYSYTEDGSETIGSDFETMELDFQIHSGGTGKFISRFTDFSNGSGTWGGTYIVNQDNKEVELIPDGEFPLVFDITLSNDKFTLEGSIDGDRIIMKGRKK